ncbi:MAG: hypothetical protein LLG00_04715 [Planctomycetaceae bacterium]|nr:hypothetical protein [Planctomycetaceae bacterium]
MVDLSSMIGPSSEWALAIENAIDDSGQIVGCGVNASGQQLAFLLTPVAESSSLVLLGVSAISAFACA